ncbi:acyl-CoA N-acyltransferase [Paraphoma chrysanthemicola]|uniref:N-alpha-acetyltransferase 40 n=1 Tax=Paraphoma chrysanthemicola TaxID=798071 RepID=A0A8K0R094_9PLEO|nr:acyl-CoA N-acyltransferase [Paraphoma chrysanthemicola]
MHKEFPYIDYSVDPQRLRNWREEAQRYPAHFRNNYLPNNGVSRSFEACRASLQEYRRLAVEENAQALEPQPIMLVIPVNNMRKPAHIRFDDNGDMPPPYIPSRANEVRWLIELMDPTGLRERGSLDIASQLTFDFIPSGSSLSPKDQNACVEMIYETSGRDYKASSVGWNRKEKLREMINKDMMYLLIRQGDMIGEDDGDLESTANVKEESDKLPATDESPEQLSSNNISDSGRGRPIADEDSRPAKRRKISDWPDPQKDGKGIVRGFISFMFTNDDPPHEDREVLYIYEIHLHTRLRGQGLGPKLIKLAEEAAAYCGITKVMLTVFSKNTAARALYEKLGYVKDECSPKDRVTRRGVIEAEYHIMSKEIV